MGHLEPRVQEGLWTWTWVHLLDWTVGLGVSLILSLLLR